MTRLGAAMKKEVLVAVWYPLNNNKLLITDYRLLFAVGYFYAFFHVATYVCIQSKS